MAGEVGTGRIFFYHGGNTIDSFSWNLGKKTNKEVEWLVLMLDIELITKKGISKIIIINDSR